MMPTVASLAAALAVAAVLGCGPAGQPTTTSTATPASTAAATTWPAAPAGADLGARVVWDFEHATRAGLAPWVELFDFTEVGAFEILLRRYDLLGRLPRLTDLQRADLANDDGTPYPPARERRNVGRFFERLAQPVVGTGRCTPAPPQWAYNRQLGAAFEPLPPGHDAYEPLRVRVNAQLDGGGVVGIRCAGGQGGLALVYSPRPTPRGYAIITIYDDGQAP